MRQYEYAPSRANGSPRSHRESSPRMYYLTPRDHAAGEAGLSYQSQDYIPASPCHYDLSSAANDHDEDRLMNDLFDWDLYYQTQPQGTRQSSPRHSPYPSPPRSPRRHADDAHHPRQQQQQHPGAIPAVAAHFGTPDYYPGMASPYGYSGFESGSQSPPELVTGGSSPSSHSSSGSIDYYDEPQHHFSGTNLKEFQVQDPEWAYAHEDLTALHYPPYAQTDRRNHSSEVTAGLKRRHSGHKSEKRHRHLSDPNQTADVRKNGACLPCRVLKTRCAESGVCPTCRKAFPDHAHLVCNRETPAMAWPVIGKCPDVWSPNAWEEQQLCSAPRIPFGKIREISIFFSCDTSSAELKVNVQPHSPSHDRDEAVRTVDFPRELMPSERQLLNWAEAQIAREHCGEFNYAVQTFLYAYARDGEGLPKHGLVKKVHKMNCFFKIWKSPAFWCIDPSRNFTELPLSVQARLRNIARRGLDRIEHDILKELDSCLAPNGAPTEKERMAIWACLWQLILIYRELIVATESCSNRDSNGYDFYRRLTQSFFPLLTMFYHYQFRTRKSLEVSLDWMKSSSSCPSTAVRSAMLHQTARDLVDSRREFYHAIQTSEFEIDQNLSVLVIDHEVKKLNARKRPSKSSSSSSSPSPKPSSKSSSKTSSKSSASKTSSSRSYVTYGY